MEAKRTYRERGVEWEVERSIRRPRNGKTIHCRRKRRLDIERPPGGVLPWDAMDSSVDICQKSRSLKEDSYPNTIPSGEFL